jgi:iron complex transport system substrate-binding protein
LKNHYAILIIIFIAEFLFSNGCQENERQESGAGNRIISLAPHITEIIYALHGQDQLIAVTDYCRYPEEVEKKEKIGGLLNPNIEKMVRLKPTLLFGLPSHDKLNLELQKFGLTVTMMPNENIADVLNTINNIGMLIGHTDQAHELVNQINSRLDTLRMNTIKKPISAVLMIGREDGTLRNIMAAGSDTYIDELWRLVGGVNSYSDLPTRYGAINIESLLLRDPEVIIVFDMKRNKGVTRMQISPEWQYVKNLSAVQNKNIFVVGGDHTMIPGPRMVLLAEDFSKIIKSVSRMKGSPSQ